MFNFLPKKKKNKAMESNRTFEDTGGGTSMDRHTDAFTLGAVETGG